MSGVYRHFEVPAFILNPGPPPPSTNGWGFAASLLVPIIPVKSIEDHGNALTLTGEFSIGAGIADLYTGMDGGSRFPTLPNPNGQPTVYYYQADVDPGLVTFDMHQQPQGDQVEQPSSPTSSTTCRSVGVASGSRAPTRGPGRPTCSTLTPFTSWGAIFTKMEYVDGNLGFDITPSIVLALSFQTVAQTFGDYTQPEPTYVTQPSAQSPNSVVVPGVPGTGGDAVDRPQQPRSAQHGALLLMGSRMKTSERKTMKTIFAACGIFSALALGGCDALMQQPKCPELANCGGPVPIGTWVLAPGHGSCTEDINVPPTDVRLPAGVVPAARTAPPEPALFDWCDQLVTKAFDAQTGIVVNPAYIYTPDIQIGVASLRYKQDGTYSAGLSRTGTFQITFPALCMREFGATDNNPAVDTQTRGSGRRTREHLQAARAAARAGLEGWRLDPRRDL